MLNNSNLHYFYIPLTYIYSNIILPTLQVEKWRRFCWSSFGRPQPLGTRPARQGSHRRSHPIGAFPSEQYLAVTAVGDLPGPPAGLNQSPSAAKATAQTLPKPESLILHNQTPDLGECSPFSTTVPKKKKNQVTHSEAFHRNDQMELETELESEFRHILICPFNKNTTFHFLPEEK